MVGIEPLVLFFLSTLKLVLSHLAIINNIYMEIDKLKSLIRLIAKDIFLYGPTSNRDTTLKKLEHRLLLDFQPYVSLVIVSSHVYFALNFFCIIV